MHNQKRSSFQQRAYEDCFEECLTNRRIKPEQESPPNCLQQTLVPTEVLLQRMRKRARRHPNQSLLNLIERYRTEPHLQQLVRLLQKQLDRDDQQRCI